MKEFKQKTLRLSSVENENKIQIKELCQLISNHPYKDEIYEFFDIKDVEKEYVIIDYVKNIYKNISASQSKNKMYNVLALEKDVMVGLDSFEEEEKQSVFFHLKEYVEEDELKSNLKAKAIYGSKNSFFEQYDMTKFANSLFDKRLQELVRINIDYFNKLAEESKDVKRRSFRILETENQCYLRGITSEKYNEYGVGFTFVVSILFLRNHMKNNPGTNYRVQSCSINESKLDLILSETFLKDAGRFGKVSSAIEISTTDLGDCAIRFNNLLRVGDFDENGIFLLPDSRKHKFSNKFSISHRSKPNTVLQKLSELGDLLNSGDDLIDEIKSIDIKLNPDELRQKILIKVNNPKSKFSEVSKISDVFKRKIDNEINGFANLLEMCNKAEDLDINYDLKDKLRYLISDIVLYGKS